MEALITGISGQDGAHLSKLLLSKGYEVFGIDILPDYWRLDELGIRDRIHIIPADITDLSSLVKALKQSEADEVYHLASQSFVGSSFDHPIAAGHITGIGTLNVLEAIRMVSTEIKMYNAATSELYGNDARVPQNEDTRMIPSSPYAVAKMYAYNMCRLYREAYGMFVCNGILFNHEGEFRGEEFVTRRISLAAARIKLGLQDKLKLGNLDAYRDWGYAPEYVELMWRMLRHPKPTDAVAATGRSHSVKKFCELAFNRVGLDWREYVSVDRTLLRPSDVNHLRGDAHRAKMLYDWEAKTDLSELVRIMVDADTRRLQ